MSATTGTVTGAPAGRRVAWRGRAAMAVMVLGMLDTMLPALHLVPVAGWIALELGLALAVAVPGRGRRSCTPLAAHRALGLIVMAALTGAMAGMGRSTAASPMGAMHEGLPVLPAALVAAGAYAGWSLWRARRHGERLELLVGAASVALMGAVAIVA